MTLTLDIAALFTDAAATASHGRYAAKLTDADTRRNAFGMRDAAAAEQAERERAAAERAARDAAAAIDTHRAVIADSRAAWSDMANAERANDGAAYLLAAARAHRLATIPLSRFDALAHTASGLITRAVRAYHSRSNAGETNRMLVAANVDAADVFNYAAELAIREGLTRGGMPTYGGMYRMHRRAAGLLRRDAFAGRAGYVTVSADDLTAEDSAALRADIHGRGIAHVRLPETTPPTVAELMDSARVTPPVDIDAHRAAMADAHRSERERAAAARADAETLGRRRARWTATPPVRELDDAARMGSAVVTALTTGATFDDIRAVFSATDDTLTRYAYAAADVRRAAPVVVERSAAESAVWRAYMDAVHTMHRRDDCDDCAALPAEGAPERIAANAAAERRRRERAERLANDARESAPVTPRVHSAYSDAPALPEFTPWIHDAAERASTIDAANDAALGVILAAHDRAAAVVRAATDSKSRAAAKRRAGRIMLAADDVAAEILSHAAAHVSL